MQVEKFGVQQTRFGDTTGKTYRKLDSHTAPDRHARSRMNQALRWVEVRKSRIHGRGVFARRDIPAGTRLIEYVGLPISKKKSAELTLKQNRYLFTLNGASDLMVEILGNKGLHTRIAVGCASLPLNAAVEVDAVFAVD